MLTLDQFSQLAAIISAMADVLTKDGNGGLIADDEWQRWYDQLNCAV